MTTILGHSKEVFVESEYWRLFIDKRHQGKGEKAYDEDKSPGHYNSMMAALREFVFIEHFTPLNFETYDGIHQFLADQNSEIVKEARAKRSNKRVAKDRIPVHAFFIPPLQPDALKELKKKRIKGQALVEEHASREDAYKQEWVMYGGKARIRKHYPKSVCILYPDKEYSPGDMRVETCYDVGNGCKRLVDAIFKDHYKQMKKAKNDRAKIEIIADTVRTLHVCHFFPDGNGRVNMPIVMNRLLCEQGFLPSILPNGPEVFGGIKTKKELAKDIITGMQDFAEIGLKKDEVAKDPKLTQKVAKVYGLAAGDVDSDSTSRSTTSRFHMPKIFHR